MTLYDEAETEPRAPESDDIDPEVERRVLAKHGVKLPSSEEQITAEIMAVPDGPNTADEIKKVLAKHGRLHEDY